MTLSGTSTLADQLTVRFLDLIKPFTPLLPEVASPESKVPFNQKIMWTGVNQKSETGSAVARSLNYGPAYPLNLFGDEPNASLWHRLIRHIRSAVLAAYDAGQ